MTFYNQEENKNGMGTALGWDDEISQESNFKVLDPGTYEFVITNFERDQFEGSEKMGPCAMAKLTINAKNVDTGEEGEVSNIALFLNSKMEWKLSEFFVSIGDKKPGEPFRPNWNNLVGKRGKAIIEINSYTSKTNGKTYENNQIKEWLPPTENKNARWKAGSF